MLCLMQWSLVLTFPCLARMLSPDTTFSCTPPKRGNYGSCSDGHRASKGTGNHHSFCLWRYGFGWCRQEHRQVVSLQETHLACTNTNICTSWGFPWLRNPHIYMMPHQTSEIWSEFFLIVLEVEEYFDFIWALQQWSDYYIPCHTELDEFSTESYRTAAKYSLAW